MTPTELKEARRKLGLSAAGLARMLRLGSHGGRTVRRWEAGENAIPGPAQVAIEMMLELTDGLAPNPDGTARRHSHPMVCQKRQALSMEPQLCSDLVEADGRRPL